MLTRKFISTLIAAIFIFAGSFSIVNAQQVVYAEVSGQGEPALLIPGLISSGEVFDEMLSYLNEHFECHVITFAGYAGKPAIDTEQYLPEYQMGILSYMKERGIEQATLIGHSLGGFMSLKIASEHPAKVNEVVILDALPFLAGAMNPEASEGFNQQMANQYQQSISMMEESQLRQMRAMSLKSMLINTNYEQTIVDWAMKSDPKTEAYTATEMMGIDLRDDIEQIQSPVLVLAAFGGESPNMPQMTRDSVKKTYGDQYKKVDQLTLKVAKKARHFIMYDDPNWVKSEILAFINR